MARALTAGLLASAVTTSFAPGRAVKITRLDGTVIRLVEAMSAKTLTGNVYEVGHGLIIGSIPFAANEEAVSVDLDVIASPGGAIDLEDVRAGIYRGADVEVYLFNRLLASDGVGLLFAGKIGRLVERNFGRITMEAVGPLGAAGLMWAHKYSPNCRWLFGDADCGIDIDALSDVATVASITDAYTLVLSGATGANDYWNNGHIRVTSGLMTGFDFEIRDWVAGTQTLKLYLPVAGYLAAADGVTLFPGCTYLHNDTAGGCPHWDNILNFGGEPYMPGLNGYTSGGSVNLEPEGPQLDLTPFGFGDDLGPPDGDDFTSLAFTSQTVATVEQVIPAGESAEVDITKLTFRVSHAQGGGGTGVGGRMRGVIYSASGELLGSTDVYTFDGSEPAADSGETKEVELTLTSPVRVAREATINPGVTHQTEPNAGNTSSATFLSRVEGLTRLSESSTAPHFASITGTMPDPWPVADDFVYDEDDIGKIAIRLTATPVA